MQHKLGVAKSGLNPDSPNRFGRYLNRAAVSALPTALAIALSCAGNVDNAFAGSFGVAAYIGVYEWCSDIGCQPGFTTEQDPVGLGMSFGQMFFPNSAAYTLAGPTSAYASMGPSFAAADLAAGTLRVFAEVPGGFHMDSIAGFSDTLTPLADGILHFDIDVSGTKNPGINLVVGDAYIDGGVFFAIDNTRLKGVFGEYDSDGCISGSSYGPLGSLFGPIQCHYGFDITATAGVPFRFTTALDGTVEKSLLDLSHTMTLRTTGVPYTSASGVFLTATDVPEPSSVWLLGFGLVVLSRRRYRRRPPFERGGY
jgi:PEP-CTERM motif